MRLVAAIVFLFVSSGATWAASDCYQSEPVVSVHQNWENSQAFHLEFYLPTRTSYGSYLTWAAARLSGNEEGVSLRFDHFPPPSMPFGLPYTIHKVEITLGSETLLIHDFTSGCEGPGLSIMPGQQFEMPVLTVPPAKAPLLRENRPLRIKVWGMHA